MYLTNERAAFFTSSKNNSLRLVVDLNCQDKVFIYFYQKLNYHISVLISHKMFILLKILALLNFRPTASVFVEKLTSFVFRKKQTAYYVFKDASKKTSTPASFIKLSIEVCRCQTFSLL